MYGANDASNELRMQYARNCILARRLIEQGVRFVQLFNGAYQTGGEGVSNWDGHKQVARAVQQAWPGAGSTHRRLAARSKATWFVEKTHWSFGVPSSVACQTFQAGASGRDHNPAGFTVWLAGAGVKAPFTYGATDEFG